MARELTAAAKCAAAIRAQLKSTGLPCKVTSSNFSMGNSVDVTINNAVPEVVRLVNDLCGRYQYGHFDGMTDCYEYSNGNKDLPQAKFVHVHNEVSDEIKQAVFAFVRGYFDGGEMLPESLNDARDCMLQGDWVSDLVYRQFRQADSAYWTHAKQRKAA